MIRIRLCTILILLSGASAFAQAPAEDVCISRRNPKDKKSIEAVQMFEAEASGPIAPSYWKTDSGIKMSITDNLGKPIIVSITQLPDSLQAKVETALAWGGKVTDAIKDAAKKLVASGLNFNSDLCIQPDKQIYLKLVGTGMVTGKKAKIYLKKDADGIKMDGVFADDKFEGKAIRATQ